MSDDLNPAHYFPLYGGTDGPPVELLRMFKQATLL